MEVSGPLLQAPTPAPAIALEQNFLKRVSDLPPPVYLRVMSFIEFLSLNDVNGIRHKFTPYKRDFYPNTSKQFLIHVKEYLTKKEKAKLNELLALFVTDPKRPTDNEIERCFASLGVDFRNTCLKEIVKAIQDRTLSKQDIENTSMVIKHELTRLNIRRDFVFTKFSEENYKEELDKDLKGAGSLKDNITQLDFSYELIKAIPNILGVFKHITRLSFSRCQTLTSPPDLSGNQKLKYLNFARCSNLTTPPDLINNQLLIELNFAGCKSLTEPPDLSGNQFLESLSFSCCTSLQRPPDLSGKHALMHLWFRGCSKLQRPPDLSTLTQLSTLDMKGVFSKRSRLNRKVSDDHKEAQALRRAIEKYRKKTKRKLEASAFTEAPPEKRGRSNSSDSDFTEAPPEKRGRSNSSDSDDFEAFAEKVASNWESRG